MAVDICLSSASTGLHSLSAHAFDCATSLRSSRAFNLIVNDQSAQPRIAAIVRSYPEDPPASCCFRMVTPDLQERGLNLATIEGQEAIAPLLDGVGLLVVLAGWQAGRMGTEFVPKLDEGDIVDAHWGAIGGRKAFNRVAGLRGGSFEHVFWLGGLQGVRGIPALFLFKDGQLVSNKTGAAPKAALESWIQEAI